MTLQEIKDAIKSGKKVHWANTGYKVVCDKNGEYLIVWCGNGSCIGLTWQDGVTMNGKPEEFFIGQ
jgi:hypothetical protein